MGMPSLLRARLIRLMQVLDSSSTHLCLTYLLRHSSPLWQLRHASSWPSHTKNACRSRRRPERNDRPFICKSDCERYCHKESGGDEDGYGGVGAREGGYGTGNVLWFDWVGAKSHLKAYYDTIERDLWQWSTHWALETAEDVWWSWKNLRWLASRMSWDMQWTRC